MKTHNNISQYLAKINFLSKYKYIQIPFISKSLIINQLNKECRLIHSINFL